MKKLLILSVAMLMTVAVNAQEQNQAGASPEYVYCEIVGTGKLFSNKVTIEMDFGQATKFAESRKLREENGKPIVFNSMVDAMNWMGMDGWYFEQAYVVTISNQNVYHWLLKKEIGALDPEVRAEVFSKFRTKK